MQSQSWSYDCTFMQSQSPPGPILFPPFQELDGRDLLKERTGDVSKAQCVEGCVWERENFKVPTWSWISPSAPVPSNSHPMLKVYWLLVFSFFFKPQIRRKTNLFQKGGRTLMSPASSSTFAEVSVAFSLPSGVSSELSYFHFPFHASPNLMW